jgi:deoxyribonuclease-1-like protein
MARRRLGVKQVVGIVCMVALAGYFVYNLLYGAQEPANTGTPYAEAANTSTFSLPGQTPGGLETAAGEGADMMRLCSFNVQNWGVNKTNDTPVMDVLSDIIEGRNITGPGGDFTGCDIIGIQEISKKDDAIGLVVEPFIGILDTRSGKQYSYKLSEYVGEQYLFIYDSAKVEFTGYEATLTQFGDRIKRPLHAASFRSGGFDFILANIHTSPDNATREIMVLEEVIKYLRGQFPGEGDVIVLGDYNADCDYFDENVLTGIRDPAQYLWMIGDSLDTTVSPNTDCTYDRIVAPRAFITEDFTGRSGVFYFGDEMTLPANVKPGDVSDHYPVWAEFFTGNDTDHP